ncbi:MAG TPA: hypothetical protein VGP95_19865 [Gemmatimonadaceae bacterium]|nr:hypothetical protein [Gemmatimonadaceae bacterium]
MIIPLLALALVATVRQAVPSDAELPRVYLNTAVSATPSSGRVVRIKSSDNLQRALDAAQCGDQVLLPAGAKFTGSFTIARQCSATAWITVTTDGCATLPAEGARTSPTAAACYAKLSSRSAAPALSTKPGAKFWRFIGVEFTNEPSVATVNGTVYLGESSAAQTTLASIPTDIILDRVYVHAPDNTDDRRCVTFNAARTAIVESYVAGCKSGFDAQAVTGTNGPGPFKIVNNYLEASGENIAFGGADPWIANLVPSDIEIRHNHIFKPMGWRGKWNGKNLIEFKAGRRVLIEANVAENSYPDGQAGFAVLLWSVNQDGGCTWCVTEHVTVRNNLFRNIASGFQLTARWSERPSALMNHVTIRNNLMIGINNPAVAASTSRVFQIGNGIAALTIDHNTGFGPDATFMWGDSTKAPEQIITNNLTGGGSYQIFTPFGAGSVAWGLVAGPRSKFAGNVVALASDWSNVIPGNYYPKSLNAIGLAGGGGAAYSATAAPADLGLGASSPYRGKGTDGKDPGANVPAILAATQGVVQR